MREVFSKEEKIYNLSLRIHLQCMLVVVFTCFFGFYLFCSFGVLKNENEYIQLVKLIINTVLRG